MLSTEAIAQHADFAQSSPEIDVFRPKLLNSDHSEEEGDMKMKIWVALTVLLTAVSYRASAVPITGGVTNVQLDAGVAGVILGAGVTPAPTGSATFDAGTLTFGFPITGGDLSGAVIPGSTIEHDTSGISFSAGQTSLIIGEFLIDTTSLVISGSAMSTAPAVGNPLALTGGVPLFDLTTGSTVTGFPFNVSLTGAAAGALNDTFGVGLFTAGLQIGVAATNPQVAAVPVPLTLPLVGLGLGLIALTRRKVKA